MHVDCPKSSNKTTIKNKLSKKRRDDDMVVEFKSFGNNSANFDAEEFESTQASTPQEAAIEIWLSERGIVKGSVDDQKLVFFNEKKASVGVYLNSLNFQSEPVLIDFNRKLILSDEDSPPTESSLNTRQKPKPATAMKFNSVLQLSALIGCSEIVRDKELPKRKFSRFASDAKNQQLLAESECRFNFE